MLQAIRGRRKDDNPRQQDAQDATATQENEKKLDENPKNDISPNAEVWRKYVEETDRYDKDMVDGWNNSLDVLLIFASLFSAVSSAFVLESTQDLKPDYAESSAQTLAAILQAVSAGGPTNTSDLLDTNQSEFSPNPVAITVNILWFMSLSLSVSVALIAIVAKDWCYQFMSGRTGQHILQGRRRQLRWEGIEKWKLQEIIAVLPLMMHSALFLFATGLALYLWDINPRVALPVVVTTAFVGLFYFVTLFLPLFFRYCPFTTGVIKLFLAYWSKVVESIITQIFQAFGWLAVPFMVAHALIKHCTKLRAKRCHSMESDRNRSMFHRLVTDIPFKDFWNVSRSQIDAVLKLISLSFMAYRSQMHLDGQETPMDEVTSAMLGWMITQCEDLRSVDIAFHALVCVKPWLPRGPLVNCGAFQVVLARLHTSLGAWKYSLDAGEKDERNLRRSVVLQSQCLSLMVHSQKIKLLTNYHWHIHDLDQILDRSWECSEDYQLASKELGNLSLHIPTDRLYSLDTRQQINRQWELLRMLISKEVTSLSPTDTYHLVGGIAKSYLYRPDQPPSLLLDLLRMPEYQNNQQLCRMIGIALMMACVTNYNYPGSDPVPDRDTRVKRARALYMELTTKAPIVRDYWRDYEQVMHFGLIGILLIEPGSEWSIPPKSIVDLISGVNVSGLASHKYRSLGMPHDFLTTAINWLLGTAHVVVHNPLPQNPPPDNHGGVMIEIDVPSTATHSRGIGRVTSQLAVGRLHNPAYLEHAKHIIRLARCCLDQTWSSYSLISTLTKINQTNLLQRTYETLKSDYEDIKDIVPHCMSFLWVTTSALLLVQHSPRHKPKGFDASSMLAPLGAQGGLPQDVGGMGYVESWIRKLEAACEHDPQNVLDSEVLEEIIKHFSQDRYRELQPSAVGASNAEPPRTWLRILTGLSQACQARVDAARAKLGETSEGTNEGEDKEAQEEYTSERDDKSTGGRIAEGGTKWDQLPPEVLEYAQLYDSVHPGNWN